MQYIYARVSKDELDNKNQLHDLRKQYPEAVVVEEKASGYKEKPQLNTLLAALRAGDTLIVYALDRLGRHAWKALKLIEELSKRDVILVSKREGLDLSTSAGKMLAHMMLGFAEMERNLISERTKTALAAKKAEAQLTGNGWKCGRRPVYDQAVLNHIVALRARGLTMLAISKATGVSTGRVCQVLKAS